VADLEDPPARNEMLHLYKIAAESAERFSDRRQMANSFYLTFVSALLAAFFASFADPEIPDLARIVTCLLGILVSIGWLIAILGFRAHNSIKFRVIDEMEEQLAFRFFRTETKYYAEQEFRARFTSIEMAYPLVMAASFVLLLFIASGPGGASAPPPPPGVEAAVDPAF
jgi:hypothetical protein